MVDIFMNGIIAVVLFYAAIYTLKIEHINRINKHQENHNLFDSLYDLSNVTLFVIIMIQLGDALFPQLFLFEVLREIISLSIFNRLIQLMIFYMVFESTLRLSKVVLDKDPHLMSAMKESVAFASGMIALGLSVMVFYIQNAFTGQLMILYIGTEVNLVFELIVNGLLYLIPAIVLIVNGYRYLRQASISRQSKHLMMPYVYFIGVGYIVAVQSISVFNTMYMIVGAIGKKIGKFTLDTTDDLLLLGSSASASSVVSKLNYYVLMSSFVVHLLSLYLAMTPFPMYKSVYQNTSAVIMLLMMPILLYFVIEALSRYFSKIGRYIRMSFIPLFIVAHVLPFAFDIAQKSQYFTVNTGISLFHRTKEATDGSFIAYLLCLFGVLLSIAFYLHLFTGDTKKKSQGITVLPIMGWMQMFLFSIFYPILITRPPFYLVNNQKVLLIVIVVSTVLISGLVGLASYFVFNSEHSKISGYIHVFWKSRVRVFAVVTLITIGLAIPLILRINTPVQNINDDLISKHTLFDGSEYELTETCLIKDQVTLVLTHTDKGTTKLIQFDLINDEVINEQSFNINYDGYSMWDNNQIVFHKSNNMGFVLINLESLELVHEESISQTDSYEYLSFDYSESAILATIGTNQYLIDAYAGEIVLNTVGNNFYKLVPGSITYLNKDKSLHKIIDGYVVDMEVPFNITAYENIYATVKGFYTYDNGVITLMDDYLVEEVSSIDIREIGFNPTQVQIVFDDEYVHLSGKLASELYEVFMKSTDFEVYKPIKLVQNVYTNYDVQHLAFVSEQNYYLYDENQVSYFNNDVLVGRVWRFLINEGADESILFGDKQFVHKDQIWVFDQQGTAFSVGFKSVE